VAYEEFGRNKMEKRRVYAVPNLVTPNKPIEFNEDVCMGCNLCVETCQMDVFIPNTAKRKPPIVMYPDECWQCGCCVKECPHRENGAIKMNWPLMLKMRWKDKETGEHFRYGMPNPPPANRRPPVGGWDIKVKKRQ
jgi:NAD-dependent dihydropyrimidine dehydrogenase PreA subunit